MKFLRFLPVLAFAAFVGGCFRGVQGVFLHVQGVKNAVSGYDGGAANIAINDLLKVAS